MTATANQMVPVSAEPWEYTVETKILKNRWKIQQLDPKTKEVLWTRGFVTQRALAKAFGKDSHYIAVFYSGRHGKFRHKRNADWVHRVITPIP